MYCKYVVSLLLLVHRPKERAVIELVDIFRVEAAQNLVRLAQLVGAPAAKSAVVVLELVEDRLCVTLGDLRKGELREQLLDLVRIDGLDPGVELVLGRGA